MRTQVIFACLLLMSAAVNIAAGQDLSNYYTPYGFQLPLLEQGEYSFFLRTNYNKYAYEYRDDVGDLTSESESKDLYVSADALYAITSRMLVRTSISYYPPQTSSKGSRLIYDPFGGPYMATSKYDQDGYIRHGALLVFRPKSRIEIFADYWMESWGEDQYSTDQTPPTMTSSSKRDYYYVRAGISIKGRL